LKFQKLSDELAAVRATLAAIPDGLDESVRNLAEKLEAARDRFAQMKALKETLTLDESKLIGRLETIGDFGPDAVCDRCGRPIGDDRDQIISHLNEELSENRKALESTSRELAELERSGKQLRSNQAELEKLFRDRQKCAAQQESLERLVAESEQRKKSCEAQLNQLVQRTSLIPKGTFTIGYFHEVVRKLGNLEAVERKGLTLRGQIMAEESLRGRRDQVMLKQEANRGVVAKLEASLAEIGFDPGAAEQARQLSHQANRDLESARETAARTQQLLELKKQELGQVRIQVAELEKLTLELNDVRTKHFYGEKLGRLFAEFRKELIAGIRPRLAEAGSRLMADMSGGRYQLMELDEEYNIRLFDNGQFYGIDRYSGGETDLANLCLRLAISMTLTESAGMERSMLILDEVFGSQDEGRRELIYQGLAGLKRRFPQILAITHIEELKHRVETVIELVPTGSGWSEVQIDGHPS
jgi:exonuclease SbcC